MEGAAWQNQELRALRPRRGYLLEDVVRLEGELGRRGTLSMRPLATGLFPAAAVSDASTGYGDAWVRDNVYVAHAHHLCGRSDVAARTVRALFEFWWRHRRRFDAVIAGDADPGDAMLRPHVRFDGATLEERSAKRWPHAQNDALGYALWLGSRLARTGALALDRPFVETLALLTRYFSAIRYWEDEDSGHWEEIRKRSASSIGTVLAGLEALSALARERHAPLREAGFDPRLLEAVAGLTRKGRAALEAILPSECVQPVPRKRRRYDAALLFLVHPLGVVGHPSAEQILSDVARHLEGPHGIRRYLGDSYWAPDYDLKFPPEDRTRDYSEDPAARDALLERVGDEAQWCIFDPVLSAYYGRRYLETLAPDDLERQVHHFERSLAQVTPAWQCPELYYLRHGAYAPNPHTPLLWTQANLSVALAALRASAAPS